MYYILPGNRIADSDCLTTGPVYRVCAQKAIGHNVPSCLDRHQHYYQHDLLILIPWPRTHSQTNPVPKHACSIMPRPLHPLYNDTRCFSQTIQTIKPVTDPTSSPTSGSHFPHLHSPWLVSSSHHQQQRRSPTLFPFLDPSSVSSARLLCSSYLAWLPRFHHYLCLASQSASHQPDRRSPRCPSLPFVPLEP